MKPTKQPTLKPVSFTTHFLLINKLTCHYNFSLLASFILYGRFPANERVCLNMHRFCSIDNWLCVPIVGILRYVQYFMTDALVVYCGCQFYSSATI